MAYTHTQHFGAVHLQHIQPLDERIIKMTCSVIIENYKTVYSDTLLEMYTRLALSGTKHKSKDALHTYLKKNGIMLSVTTHAGIINYDCTTTAPSFGKAIAILKEILTSTTFPNALFKNEQALILEENREAYDNAKNIVAIDFANQLYPKGSLYRKETLAEQKEDILQITTKNCHALSKEILHGEWYISIVGSTAVVKKCTSFCKYLAQTANTVIRTHESYVQQQATQTSTTVTGKTNVEVKIGNIFPLTVLDDEYVPFMFGLQVLGKMGGFSGRLMSTVREKEGLTYGIYAQLVHYDMYSSGYWNIFTFFTAKDLKQGIRSTTRELRLIVKKGITNTELVVFKEILKNQFLIAYESNERRLRLYHQAFVSGKDESLLLRIQEEIQQVKKEAVNNALRAHIDLSKIVISLAGPVTKSGEGIF